MTLETRWFLVVKLGCSTAKFQMDRVMSCGGLVLGKGAANDANSVHHPDDDLCVREITRGSAETDMD